MGKLSPSSTDFAEAMGISDQKSADLWQWLLTRIEKSQTPFLTKIKELFKQDHEEGFESGGKQTYFQQIVLNHWFTHTFAFSSAASDILKGKTVEWRRKAKWLCRRKKKGSLPHSCRSILKRRKWEWRHTGIYQEGGTFPLFRDVSRGELFTRSVIELCMKDTGVGRTRANHHANEISKSKGIMIDLIG